MTYTKEEHEFAEGRHPLGAEYRAASVAAERFLEHWTEDHVGLIAEQVIKPVVEQITNDVARALEDWLIENVESNAASKMCRMVEDSVEALIGGHSWANRKYIQPDNLDARQVRETLAKLYSDEIKDGRIADLEREIDNLKKQLSYYKVSF